MLLQKGPKDVRAFHNVYHLGRVQSAYRLIELSSILGALLNYYKVRLCHRVLEVFVSLQCVCILKMLLCNAQNWKRWRNVHPVYLPTLPGYFVHQVLLEEEL